MKRLHVEESALEGRHVRLPREGLGSSMTGYRAAWATDLVCYQAKVYALVRSSLPETNFSC